MKIKIALLSASVALLGACGELPEVDDAGTQVEYYAFSTGVYALSNVMLKSQTDQCGYLGAYADADKRIGVTVAGSAVTFNLSNNPNAAANTLDKGTLNGNAVEQATQTNFDMAFGDTCVVRVKRTVTGNLVNTDTAALTLDFSVAVEAGTCSSDNTTFDAVPCASTYQFTATKQ